jgi:Flp pilus assembly protein TadD
MGRKDSSASAANLSAGRLGNRHLWPIWAGLAAAVWIAFSPVLNNGFVDLDDRDWILDNHAFRGLGWDQIGFAFTTMKGGVYQPLGWLLQSFTFAAFGLDPRGWHLVSLVFHILNVVLAHLLCVRLVERSLPEAAMRLGARLGWLCAVPVVLYAIHPLRVELVAWASPQAYLPSITLSLLATLAYLRAHPSMGVYQPSWMIRASALVVLAVLTKGSAVVLPVVFVILDAYPLGRLNPGRAWWPEIREFLLEKAPIFVFCAALSTVAFVAKQMWGVDPEANGDPTFFAKIAQASFGACFYLAKTVWPFGVTAYYPRPEGENFLTPVFGACVVLLLVSITLAIKQRRRWPWLPPVLAAYLVIVAPYLGLARVSVTLASDRYCQAALLAWVVLACVGLCKLAERPYSRPTWLAAGATTVALALGLTALTWSQCRVWENSEHLWRQALENAPWSARLHDYLGSTLAEDGKLEPAIAEFREALRIRPDDFEANCNLGVALDRQGDTGAAIAYLKEAARLRPKNAKAHLNLGAALARQGSIGEAVALYHEALQMQPNNPNLRFNLGIARLQQRRVDEAIVELKRAIAIRPWYSEAVAILAGAYVLQGRQDDAIAEYHKALEIDPDHPTARIDLGMALARQKKFSEAVAQLREAIKRNPKNADAHHVLAAILVSMGRIRDAADEYEDLLSLKPDHPQARAFLDKVKGRRF